MEKNLTVDEQELLAYIEKSVGGDLSILFADKDMSIKDMQLQRMELLESLEQYLFMKLGESVIDAGLALLIYNRIFENKYEKAKETGDFNSMLYACINMDVINAGVSPEIERIIDKIKL